jgi:hypothetical protein
MLEQLPSLFEGQLIFVKRAVKGLEVCASFLELYQKSSQSLRRESEASLY